MIRITSFPPSPLLAPYIHFMWIARTSMDNEISSIIMPPTGFILLTLFTDKSRYFVKLSGRGEFHYIPRATFQGQHFGPLETKSYALQTSTVGIVFKSTAPHKLWGLNMSEFTQKIVNAEDVLGARLSALMERLEQDDPDQKKIQLVTEFLEHEVRNPYKQHIQIDNIVALMHSEQGIISVGELAHYFQVTPRLLEKKFTEQIGITPKYHNRVIQFNNMLSILKYEPGIKWSELAFRGGYYDQAHLIKTFIEFTGKSPVQYDEMDNRFTQTHLAKNSDRDIVDHF